MVWLKWSDYQTGNKKKKERNISKQSQLPKKPKHEPRTKIIPGKHPVEFRKASEL